MNTVNAATDSKDAIGQISTGGPLDGLDPTVAMGKLFTVGLQLVFIVVGVMLLIYMLWGGIKWITSSGEPEALEKARSRIIHALVGGLIVISVIAIFGLIAGNIIGLIEYIPGVGFKFRIPTINDQQSPNTTPACEPTYQCVANNGCDPTAGGTEKQGYLCPNPRYPVCCQF